MAERIPIFRARGDEHKLGYIEGNEAFDLSGKRCCNYNAETGNLLEFNSEKIIGYVSLEGKVVGVSWIIDELFSNLGKSEVPAGRSGFLSEEMDRVFEMLRERVGLNETGPA